MPSLKNWGLFFYVNLAFGFYVMGVFYFGQVAKIKANWPLYRCNPIYMPLADNIETNFVYCMQNMQSSYMGFLLQPLTHNTSSLSTGMGGFMNDINMVRAMFDKVRTFFSSGFQSIFGVFLNLIIEFQKIIIGIKDLIGKTVGVITTLLYLIDGAMQTMQSAWSGPPGQMVQALGKCFHPETNIKLNDGTTRKMKFIDLGDILEDGAIVESIMKIDNIRNPESLYVIKEAGVNNEDIYVTGSHLVFNKTQNKFIAVKKYHKAVKTDLQPVWFSCLITSNHKIKIGSETFWDWEDHFVKPKPTIFNILSFFRF